MVSIEIQSSRWALTLATNGQNFRNRSLNYDADLSVVSIAGLARGSGMSRSGLSAVFREVQYLFPHTFPKLPERVF